MKEVREEVNESIDHISDELEDLDLEQGQIHERLEVLEEEVAFYSGGFQGGEIGEIEIPDLSGAFEELAEADSALDATVTDMGLSVEEMTLAMEEMAQVNDSLVQRIESLEDDLDDLQWLVSQIDSRTQSSSGGSGSSGSRETVGGGSSGGTGGTSGGGTSGSSGGRN